jgi:S-adenosylmethionine:tRNA ribosyltransferase-isomerase
MAAAGVIADFELLAHLEATEPAEARGLARDEVRLLVSDAALDSIEHAQFRDLPRWLSEGDLLVVNTSGTLNAALSVEADDGRPFDLHLSTRLPGGFWTVELRHFDYVASRPTRDARAGMQLRLPAGGEARLLAPYGVHDGGTHARLWLAQLQVPTALHE